MGDFGKLLEGLRRSVALSQETLSAESGVSQQTISKLENSPDTRPRAKTVFALVEVLKTHGVTDIELDELVKSAGIRLVHGVNEAHHAEGWASPMELNQERSRRINRRPADLESLVAFARSVLAQADNPARLAAVGSPEKGDKLARCMALISELQKEDPEALELIQIRIQQLQKAGNRQA